MSRSLDRKHYARLDLLERADMRRHERGGQRFKPAPRLPANFGGYNWMGRGPCWWHHLFSIKPGRAREAALCRLALKDPEHEKAWPNLRKPHHYYW